VHSDSLEMSCSYELPNSPEQGARLEEDPFYVQRYLAEKSSCASVQTFRASDSAGELNRRVFLAGLLLSAAAAMILEALATGRTEEAET
jgi:hypothetical protein